MSPTAPAPTADPPPDCCSPAELAPCAACSAPPDRTRRPGNTSPERLGALARGAMIHRIDNSLAFIQAAVFQELAAFFPGLPDDEMGALARGVGIRVAQAAQAAIFPEEFCDGDPGEYLAGLRDVMRRRAEMEQRAGRTAEAAHWEAVAEGCDPRAGLIPASGTLERVSPDGFRMLVERLRGGPAPD